MLHRVSLFLRILLLFFWGDALTKSGLFLFRLIPLRHYYSNVSVPKAWGTWKSGVGVSIAFHDRKWGLLSLSPHL